jgi:hypothetical protein
MRRSRLAAGVAILLLVCFAVQAWLAARSDSVTIDEFADLPVGLAMIRTGDTGLDPINPPLSRIFFALSQLPDPPRFDPGGKRLPFRLGEEFMRENADRYHERFVRARVLAILLALLLGTLVHSWARLLYGRGAGLVALFFFAFSPDMLAHGHLVAADLAGALGFTAAALATWAFFGRPSPARAVLLGGAIGLGALLKLSGVVAAGAVVLLALAAAARRLIRDRRALPLAGASRWAGLLLLAACAAVLVVNLGYGFRETLSPVEKIRMPSEAYEGWLTRLRASAPNLRLPLPGPFLVGLDLAANSGAGAAPEYYLGGEFSRKGWWFYHLVAFAVKTPIPVLFLSLLAVAAWVARRSRGAGESCLFVPVLLLFLANTFFNSLDIGVRHLLPAYPLLFVAIAPHVADRLSHLRGRGGLREKVPGVAAALLLAWTAATTLSAAPRYLQYFNVFGGGPSRGHEVLIDSNIDWGQDLLRLRAYMEKEGIEEVNLAYFGRVDPRVYGISYRPLVRETTRGWTIVSASYLMGRPYVWYGEAGLAWTRPGQFSWLKDRDPVDRVGALFVYDRP